MQNDELKNLQELCKSVLSEVLIPPVNYIEKERRLLARALLQRLEAEEAGYVLVPKKPTNKMLEAGRDAIGSLHGHCEPCWAIKADAAYSAMLAAAHKVTGKE